METVNLRIKTEAKEQVRSLAEKFTEDNEASSLSGAARELIYVGLGFELGGGEIRYEGPLGVVSRPFAGASFDGKDVTLSTRLPERTIGRLEGAFGERKHPAAQKALALGLLVVQVDDIKITGPSGGPRPFANINVEGDIQGERAREAFDKIRTVLPDSK